MKKAYTTEEGIKVEIDTDEPRKKLPQTGDSYHEPMEPQEPQKSTMIRLDDLDKDGKLKSSDHDFILRNFSELSEKTIKSLKAEIEKKIKARPQFSFWKCTNKRCQWKGRLKWDAKPGACLFCNWMQYKDGGQLVKMSKKEAEQFVKDEQERFRLANERAQKAAFYRRNEQRKKEGLDPIAYDEYLKEQKKLSEEHQKRSAEYTKAYKKMVEKRSNLNE